MRRIILILTSALLALPLSAQQDGQKQWAVVNLPVNYMREEPDYEAGNGTQALMGTVVEVLATDRYWKQILSPDPYTAWTNELGLAMMDEAKKDAYIAAPKWICMAEHSHVWSEPDVNSLKICPLIMGDLVRKVNEYPDPDGWIMVQLPSGRVGWTRQKDLMDFRKWSLTRKLTADNIINLAKEFNGAPYLWGGNSVDAFDCSGLTKFVFFMNGVLLPRNASQQAFVGEEIPAELEKMEPGDLVFFGTKATDKTPLKASHVAIYMGDGKIIQASQVVRINSLRPGDADFYDREIISVRRIIGHVDDGTGAVSVKSSPMYFKQ